MVIHIYAADGSDTPSTVEQLVEKRNGRELHLGKRLIGWNLNDTIAICRRAVPDAQVQQFVRHFASQRHVVFEDAFPAASVEPYTVLAREVKNYLFAFLDTAAQERWAAQALLKNRIRSASCEVVTLRAARSIQQLEALLLSAQMVLGSYNPLVLPEPPRRTARASTRKTSKAA